MHGYLRTFLLAVALASATGCAVGVRVYDEPHGDYHRWNDREERAYRAYLAEQHREYREFARLDRRGQEGTGPGGTLTRVRTETKLETDVDRFRLSAF